MYQYYREKLDFNHFWELEGQTAQKYYKLEWNKLEGLLYEISVDSSFHCWKLNYSTNFLITSREDTNWLGQGRFIFNFSRPKSRRNKNRSKIKNKQTNKQSRHSPFAGSHSQILGVSDGFPKNFRWTSEELPRNLLQIKFMEGGSESRKWSRTKFRSRDIQVGVFYVPRSSSIAWLEEQHLTAFLVVCGPCAPHVSRNYSVQTCRVFTIVSKRCLSNLIRYFCLLICGVERPTFLSESWNPTLLSVVYFVTVVVAWKGPYSVVLR